MNHIISADEFSRPDIAELFEATNQLREQSLDAEGRRELAQAYIGYQVCSLFYEPSTRTRLSFEAASAKMGMGIVSTESASEFSSAVKGETIEDTMRVLDEYDFAAIVMRHDQTGAAKRAADVVRTPLINAGDGKGEHPTQALLDLYTIDQYAGRLDGLTVVIGGDLARGRTARSLAKLLAKYDKNRLIFLSEPGFEMGDDIKEVVASSNNDYEETTSLGNALSEADIVYWTRMQKERPMDKSGQVGLQQASSFIIDKTALDIMPEHAIVMHPLPKVDEITADVDSDPRAWYFKQAGNGLYVRMALLKRAVEVKYGT